ncbi:unnamed protein product [Penicillium glandicola]
MATQAALSKSSRLIYRAPENSEEDIAFFHNIVNDDAIKILSTGRLPRPAPKKSAEEFIKNIQEATLGVIICLPQDTPEAKTKLPTESQTSDQPVQNSKPVPIGHLSLFSFTGPGYSHHRNAMIGISLADGFRGKGYGGEAINWALDWAFQKLGFVDEGREREAVYHNRAWHDLVSLSMLEHEWEVLRGIAPGQSSPKASDQ